MFEFSFAKWIQILEAVATSRSGLNKTDFTSLPLAQRLKQGKDIGERFVKKQLAMHGIRISDVSAKMDMNQKIDGMWHGEPVQIKLRRSDKEGRNDISFEVCINHDPDVKLSDQLKNTYQQGRDYKGQVKHYFVMNQKETEIYYIPAALIKIAVNTAINQLNSNWELQGHLKRLFTANNIELTPTIDQSSGLPKVMAFIPVNSVIQKVYPIQDKPIQDKTPATDIEIAVADTLKTGRGKIVIKSSNPNNIEKKMKEIRILANQNRLKVQDNGDGTVTLIKWPS